jgi:hypothetical protein
MLDRMATGSEKLMKKPLATAVLVTLAMAMTGCGNNDDATAAKSISDSIVKDQQSGTSSVMQVKREAADCIGDGLVDKIGTDKLQKYGLLTKDLQMNKDVTSVHMSTHDADAAADTFFECTDVLGMMRKAMTAGQPIDPKIKACLNDTLTKDAVHSMFVSMFSGKQQEATKSLTEAMMKCAKGPSAPH